MQTRFRSNEVFVSAARTDVTVGAVSKPYHPTALLSKPYDQVLQYLNSSIYLQNPISEEIGLSLKPVEYDVEFLSQPKPFRNRFIFSAKIGMRAKAKIDLIDNPHIPSIIDELTEMPAQAAVRTLESIDHYYAIRVFSLGKTGLNPRPVSSRQSITAVDATMAKHYMQRVKQFQSVENIYIGEWQHYGNKYTVVLIPSEIPFIESIEAWPNSISYEFDDGKKHGYSQQGGGFYATKYSVFKYLHRLRKKAGVLVIREIDNTYHTGVGVWQVREGVRLALERLKKTDAEALHLKYPTKTFSQNLLSFL